MGGNDPPKFYRAAVIGCGRIGAMAEHDPVGPKPASHVGAWRAHPRTILDAVCDHEISRVNAISDTLCYTTLSDLLRDHRLDLDIVSVATPRESHAQIVRAVCLAGGSLRAIVCEKPLAQTSEEAAEMIAACRGAGVTLWVNHLRRFDPYLRQEAARLRQMIGIPRTATGRYSGGLREGGTHMLDLMRMFLGDGRVLAAAGEDALLEFEGVRAALLGHEIGEHVVFDLLIEGDHGALHIDRFGLDLRWERVAGGYPLASGYQSLIPSGAYHDLGPRSFFRGMAEHVVRVLDGLEAPVSTGADGLAALRLIEAIEAAG